MKTYLNLFLALSFIVLLGCDKEPGANFTTDKDTYTAGETIHCKDASANAHSWKWTTPDGKTFTTQNIDFPLDSDDLGGTKTFTLEVFDKDGDETSTISKSVKVNQYILASDYFAVIDSLGQLPPIIVYKPTSKGCSSGTGQWNIDAYLPNTLRCGGESLSISFFGDMPSTLATYIVISDLDSFRLGTAYISIHQCSDPDHFSYITAISGEVNILITNNGKISTVFNNVNALNSINPGSYPVLISGNITCR